MSQLDKLRKSIDQIDDQLMKLLNERFALTNQIGKVKQAEKLEVTNNDREEEILSKTYEYINQLPVAKVYQEIFNISKGMQKLNSYLLIKDASYTYSPAIHNLLGNPYYQPLEGTSFEEFINNQDYHFKGVNITNPYKGEAYEYCLNNGIEIDEYGTKTKAINFVLNDGTLKAYNTDYQGFNALLKYYQVDLNNQDVLILGNGSTSKTVQAVLQEYSLKSLNVAVRTKRNDGEIYLNEINKLSNVDIIINTTSYGVYPNLEIEPLISLEGLTPKLIIDVNYNPYRSILAIKHPNIKYINGLYMLVEQARICEELIQGITIDDANTIDIVNKMFYLTNNISLIGMPFSGKTTVGQKLSAKIGKSFFDSDIILKEENLSLAKLLSLGFTLEDYRAYESSVIETLASVPNSVISTGGGVIENLDNIFFLKQKGLVIFLDTPFDVLKTRILDNRPLVKNENDLMKLYKKRYEHYISNADIVIKCDSDIDTIISLLEVKINEYFNN